MTTSSDLMRATYNYDVALSFLAIDENIAIALNDELSKAFTTFLYSERQKEIAASDGVDKFSSVFRTETRATVLLYREGWGQSRWTRIEETAIKSRVFNEGWRHLIIVNLDDSRLPVWIPDTHLYVSFKRFGLEQTLGVVKQRLMELDAEYKEETLEDTAQRIQRQIEKENRIKHYENWSPEGVQDAIAEVQQLFNEAITEWRKLQAQGPVMRIGTVKKRESENYVQVPCNGYFLIFLWRPQAVNALSGSYLEVRIYCTADMTSERPYDQKEITKYVFGLSATEVRGWKDPDDGKFYTSSNLIYVWTHKLLRYGLGQV